MLETFLEKSIKCIWSNAIQLRRTNFCRIVWENCNKANFSNAEAIPVHTDSTWSCLADREAGGHLYSSLYMHTPFPGPGNNLCAPACLSWALIPAATSPVWSHTYRNITPTLLKGVAMLPTAAFWGLLKLPQAPHATGNIPGLLKLLLNLSRATRQDSQLRSRCSEIVNGPQPNLHYLLLVTLG